MSFKTIQRLRRAARVRMKIKTQGPEIVRLCVHRSNQHIYAQLISGDASILGAASTLHKTVRQSLKNTSNIEAAKQVGHEIAAVAKTAGITKVTFDRSGYPYHGRVKAVAEAARESGLEF